MRCKASKRGRRHLPLHCGNVLNADLVLHAEDQPAADGPEDVGRTALLTVLHILEIPMPVTCHIEHRPATRL